MGIGNAHFDGGAGERLVDKDGIDAADAKDDAHLDLTLLGDDLHFQPTVEAAYNAADFHDQFQGWFAHFGYDAAEAAERTIRSMSQWRRI